MLAKLGESDRRLALGTTDVLRLAPLAAQWLADGHTQLKLASVLTARLPEQVDSPAALIAYRLKSHRPAKAEPTPAPQPDTRARCQQCDAVFPPGAIHSLCKTCSQEARRDQPGPADKDGLIAAIRQRRASGTFAKGARSRFIPAMPAAA